MFDFFKNGRKSKVDTFYLVLDSEIYQRLKRRARTDHISEERALREALERGMRDYWLHVTREDSAVYEYIMEIARQYEEDNKVLEALIDQNNRLFAILEQHQQQEGESEK